MSDPCDFTVSDSIGSGDTGTLCAKSQFSIYQGDFFLPEYIRNGWRWAIFNAGPVTPISGGGYFGIGPLNTPDLGVIIDFDPRGFPSPNPGKHITINMPCSPFPYTTAPLGSVIAGPLVCRYFLRMDTLSGNFGYLELVSVPFLYVVDQVCGGVGPPIPPIPPPVDTAGIDVLYWREGYTIAEIVRAMQPDGTLAPTGKLQVVNRWREDGPFDAPVVVDEGVDCTRPKLSHPWPGPPLGLVYVRPGGVFRQASYDYGRTWKPDPEDDKAFVAGDSNMAAVEVWNERTGERCLFTGAGAGITVTVYGPDLDATTGALRLMHSYAVTDKSDNASFGAIYLKDSGAIDCVIQVGGARKVFRSHDDARTWFDAT